MEFKRDPLKNKVYAVYGKVNRSNRVTTTNDVRKLKVSMAKKYLAIGLAMFKNAGVPTLNRNKMYEALYKL